MRKTLLIVFLFATVVYSQGIDNLAPKSGTDMGLKNIGIRGGLSIPYAKYAPGFATNLMADFGTIIPKLSLALELEYMKADESDPKEGISPVKLTVIGGAVKGLFRPEVDWEVKPYIGAGLGVNVILRDYPRETSDEDSSEPAYFQPRVELGADYKLNEDFTANFSTRAVLSNPSFSTILIGIRYNI
ncbi:MAG: outer membrane beta-barrel protein [Candidatus Zixiibacteriota bacterium]